MQYEASRDNVVHAVASLFSVIAYGMMHYRKVPAEYFEHLHLVSSPVTMYLRPVRLSSGACILRTTTLPFLLES